MATKKGAPARKISPSFLQVTEGARTGTNLLSAVNAAAGHKGGKIQRATVLAWAREGWVHTTEKKEGRKIVFVTIKLTAAGKKAVDEAAAEA